MERVEIIRDRRGRISGWKNLDSLVDEYYQKAVRKEKPADGAAGKDGGQHEKRMPAPR